MRRIALAVLSLVGMSSLSHADVEFNGSLCFTSVTTACQNAGWRAGDCFSIRLAPRNIGTNGADTELSLFGNLFAVGFRLPSGDPVSGSFYTVSANKVARGGYAYNLGFRFATSSPAAPTSTTSGILFTGFFNNWDEIAGCTPAFRGAATRRP